MRTILGDTVGSRSLFLDLARTLRDRVYFCRGAEGPRLTAYTDEATKSELSSCQREVVGLYGS